MVMMKNLVFIGKSRHNNAIPIHIHLSTYTCAVCIRFKKLSLIEMRVQTHCVCSMLQTNCHFSRTNDVKTFYDVELVHACLYPVLCVSIYPLERDRNWKKDRQSVSNTSTVHSYLMRTCVFVWVASEWRRCESANSKRDEIGRVIGVCNRKIECIWIDKIKVLMHLIKRV